jgi:hypothetical protein
MNRRRTGVLDVRTKLIERLCGDAARIAVLEEQNRPRVRIVERCVELVNALESGQVKIHPSQS